MNREAWLNAEKRIEPRCFFHEGDGMKNEKEKTQSKKRGAA